jgi:hypothetical protein
MCHTTDWECARQRPQSHRHSSRYHSNKVTIHDNLRIWVEVQSSVAEISFLNSLNINLLTKRKSRLVTARNMSTHNTFGLPLSYPCALLGVWAPRQRNCRVTMSKGNNRGQHNLSLNKLWREIKNAMVGRWGTGRLWLDCPFVKLQGVTFS